MDTRASGEAEKILLPFKKSEIFGFLNDGDTFRRYSILIILKIQGKTQYDKQCPQLGSENLDGKIMSKIQMTCN